MGAFTDGLKHKKSLKIPLIILYTLLVASVIILLLQMFPNDDGIEMQEPIKGENGEYTANTYSLKLYSFDNEPVKALTMSNMLPGDSVRGLFTVEVYSKEKTTLFIQLEPSDREEKLAEVLKVKVLNASNGEILYNGLIKDMPEGIGVDTGGKDGEKTVSAVSFDVTVYLSEGVGNEYQNTSLKSYLEFWVDDSDVLYTPSVSELDMDVINWLAVIVSLTTLIYILGFATVVIINKSRK